MQRRHVFRDEEQLCTLFALKIPRNNRSGKQRKVPFFLRQLWLVLRVKLMEINSDLFSSWVFLFASANAENYNRVLLSRKTSLSKKEPPNVTCLQGPSWFFSREASIGALIPLLIRGGKCLKHRQDWENNCFNFPKILLLWLVNLTLP